MKRRCFMQLGLLSAVAPGVTFAQSRPVKIGMLSPRPLAESNYAPGILKRLGELGYRDRITMTFEFRSGDGSVDRYPKLARELFDLKCDLIFAVGIPAAKALRDAGSAVPVVFMAIEYDPVKAGIVSNLRRPDGNRTGVYLPQEAMVAKRIEIMRETLPSARRVLVLSDTFSRDHLPIARKAAEASGIQLTVVQFSKQPYEFAAAFETARQARVEAAILLNSPALSTNRGTIAALLSKYRLPSIGFAIQHVEAGFLLALNVDSAKATRRVAELGVQVLKGAKPADIPVEQADEFELAINARTARALGVKIPESVLARATRIVQ